MMSVLAIVACFFLSVLVSTYLIKRGVPSIKGYESASETLDSRIFDWSSDGFWIGICETIRVFVFTFERQYAALAIIIFTKGLVARRRKGEASYYLLGTLINLSTAILFALFGRYLTRTIC